MNNSVTLGTYWDVPPKTNSGDVPIYGARVAEQDLMSALLRHGTFERLDICTGVPVAVMKTFLEEGGCWLAGHEERVRIFNHQDLPARLKETRYTAWHTPREAGHPEFLTRKYGTSWPHSVTCTVHTFSYPIHLYWQFFAWLLLGRPQDSLIMTSRAGRKGAEAIFESLAQEFNREFRSDVRYEGRLDLIPLGVDTTLFQPRDKMSMRAQFDLPSDAFLILWFGRFSAANKMDLIPLLRCYERLVLANPTRRLYFVLGGTQEGEYGKLVEQFIYSHGLTSHARVLLNFPSSQRHLLFSAADVFVSPVDNIQETFGLTPIEAMAAGVPQVVSDWDGYRDTVVHGETGFLVPTYWMEADADLLPFTAGKRFIDDHFALAQSVVVDTGEYQRYIQMLLDQPGLLRELARKSRERALTMYDWSRIIPQYEALWKELGEIPENIRHSRRPASAVFQASYFATFQQYASICLTDQSVVRLSDSGRRVIDREERLFSFAGTFAKCIEPDLLGGILLQLRDVPGVGDISFGDLTAELLEGADVGERDRIRRHILWLLKHDYASLIRP